MACASCRDGHADLQLLIDRRVLGLALRRLHREQLHARLVHEQLEIVRLRQSFDVLVAIAHQPNLNLVLAVHREHVLDDRSAAGADRQPLEMLLLREIRRDPDRLAAGRSAGASHGDAADFFSRRDVAVEQRRREIADRHVVEAVARFVGGQERRHIDFQRQQIANRVLILGPRESPEGRGAARVRRRGRPAIERRLEKRRSRDRRSRRRAVPSRRAASGGRAASGRLFPTRPDVEQSDPARSCRAPGRPSSRTRHDTTTQYVSTSARWGHPAPGGGRCAAFRVNAVPPATARAATPANASAQPAACRGMEASYAHRNSIQTPSAAAARLRLT